MPDLKHRGWALTINKGRFTWLEWYDRIESDEHVYFCGQEEIAPQTGTEHIQAYVSYRERITFDEAREKWPGAAVSAIFKSPQVNRAYCLKEDTRKPGGHTWEDGVLPIYTKRQDCQTMVEMVTEGATNLQLIMWNAQLYSQMRNVLMELRDLLTGKRSEMTRCRVYWGDTKMGKSRRAYAVANTFDKWDYVAVGMKGSRLWWDGCEMAMCIVVEDYDGEWPMRTLLRVLDRYPMRVEIKGGHCQFVAKMVIFTSNKHPRDWYPDVEYDGGPLQRRLRDHGEVINHVVEWKPIQMPTIAHFPSDVSIPPTPPEDAQRTLMDLTGYDSPIFDLTDPFDPTGPI